MRRSDIYTGILLIVAGLATIFYIIPTQIEATQNFGMNPRVFPLVVMWLATAVALLMVIVRWQQPQDPADRDGPMQRENWLFILVMSAFLATSLFAWQAFGFLVAAPATVALLMLAMGEYRHPIRLILVSAVLPTAVYFIFDRLFIIQLP